MEYRELYGVVFAQKRNNALVTKDNLAKIVTKESQLSEDAIRSASPLPLTLTPSANLIIATETFLCRQLQSSTLRATLWDTPYVAR
jgi:hypothetical protein